MIQLAMIVLLGATPMTAKDAPDLAALLPGPVEGFAPHGADAVVDRDGLFSLIDGGAEVYRALNVIRVIERRYRHPKAGDVLVDVFDMGSAEDAYGAYRHDMREDASAGIGTESEVQGGNLYFWKDRFYVSVVPLRASREARAAALAIGRAIAGRIPKDGAPPDLVRLLPPDGLVRSQVHFFHDALLFERHTLLLEDNPLGLGPETDGLLARYSLGGDATKAEGPALLLVRYPDEASATQAARAGSSAELEAGRSLKLQRAGRLLIGVLDASPDQASELIELVHKRRGGTR